MKKALILSIAMTGLLMAGQTDNAATCKGLKENMPSFYDASMDYFSLLKGKDEACSVHAKKEWRHLAESEEIGILLALKYNFSQEQYKAIISEFKKDNAKTGAEMKAVLGKLFLYPQSAISKSLQNGISNDIAQNRAKFLEQPGNAITKGILEGIKSQEIDSHVKEKLVNYYTDLGRAISLPTMVEATTLTGTELPIIYDGTNSKPAIFQNGTTTYLAEMKSGATGERIDGRIIKICEAQFCRPAKGWIIDSRDDTFGVKPDGIFINPQRDALIHSTLSVMVSMKEKGIGTDGDAQKYFVNMLKQLEPTMTLKANTPVKIYLFPDEYIQLKRESPVSMNEHTGVDMIGNKNTIDHTKN